MRTLFLSKTLFLRLALVTSLIIASASCSPDDGTDGINGTNGTNGSNGTNGTTGTANVIYSDWTPGTAATVTNIDGTNGLSFLLPAPKLTQVILDKGTVLVYVKFASTILILPYTSTAGGTVNTITFFPELGGIKIFRFNHSGVGTSSLSMSLNYRYILIPGGVPAAKTSLDLKKMTYEEVCNYYKIKQ
jgi:hypothetical protein